MTAHELKTWPAYFDAVATGEKTFEIRENDRGFRVGEVLLLHEYVLPGKFETAGRYTGRVLQRTVTYITDFGQKPGFVVMAIR